MFGTVGVHDEQQPFGEDGRVEVTTAARGGHTVEAPGAQHGFFEHVDHGDDTPPSRQRALQRPQVLRLGHRGEWREADRAALATVGNVDPLQ